MQNEYNLLQDALVTGFIDKNVESLSKYRPDILVNDYKRSQTVLYSLNLELIQCDEFWFSVAFLSKSGVAVLLNTLKELELNGIRGKILVSQYLNFTQPEALRSIKQFNNIELKISTSGNLHSKGYLFKKRDIYTFIVGSSNLTASALKSNNELNIKVSTSPQSSIIQKIHSQFQQDFDNSQEVTDEYLSNYELIYQNTTYKHLQTQESEVFSSQAPKPTLMQQKALSNLSDLRNRGERKGLLISATGTGKTFISAFDVQQVNPKRILFVVHRKNIVNAALKTFKLLFKKERTYGIFSGSERAFNEDFMFATVQTISRNEHLNSFEKKFFNYIIIDETHRVGADSYQKIINYFEPDFLLGMTATPERTDGHDIFSSFDHNIAYEIRLHKAMEDNILSPFHYFGVTDITIDGKELEEKSDFNLLVSEERVKHIIEHIKFYGCDDGIVRGLMFCSRKEECHKLSAMLNSQGYKTIALTGDDSEQTRENAIKQLESDNINERLDYIITVDIFNEGIDIPRVNQIVMLRPTNSAIIFVQQLGRGLRKVTNKKYLTVIDFIGNYQNNYLVPIALYGDTSYNKDQIRKLISSGSNTIPGSSSIHFDKISKQRIFESIDQSNLKRKKDLTTDYQLLKYQLGYSPMMIDFIEHGGRDPMSFADYSGSYYSFVKSNDKALNLTLPETQEKMLNLFSKEINNSKRLQESLILKIIISKGIVDIQEIRKNISTHYGFNATQESINSAIHNLELKFVTDKENGKKIPVKEKYNLNLFQMNGTKIIASKDLSDALSEPTFKKYLLDSCNYSIQTWTGKKKKTEYCNGFLLYEKYSRKDVFRILNWEQNPVAQNVGGYLMSKDKSNCAIFVNYQKHDHSSSTQYEDEFVNPSEFKWMSKNKRKITSPEIVRFLDFSNPIRIPLFIKKSNDEGIDFYYIGEMTPIIKSFTDTTIKNDKGKLLPVVSAHFKVYPTVDNIMYHYLIDET